MSQKIRESSNLILMLICILCLEWEPITCTEVPKNVVEVDIPMAVAATWFNWQSNKNGWDIKVHFFHTEYIG